MLLKQERVTDHDGDHKRYSRMSDTVRHPLRVTISSLGSVSLTVPRSNMFQTDPDLNPQPLGPSSHRTVHPRDQDLSRQTQVLSELQI